VSCLLRGHVVNRPDRRPLASDPFVLEFGLKRQSQIGDLDLAALATKDVRWLDITVDQAPRRRVPQALGHQPDHPDSLRRTERAAHLHVLMQVTSLHVLEDEVMPALIDSAIEDRHDIGMFQQLGTAGFTQKPLEHDRILGHPRRQDFQRHLMSSVHVNGPIDRAHAPRPEGVQDTITPTLELAELGTDRFGFLHATIHLISWPPSRMAGRRVRGAEICGSLSYEVEFQIDLPTAKTPARSHSGDCQRLSRGMVQKQVTAQGGWGRRPEGDAPRSEASALGARWLLPARPQPPSYCHLLLNHADKAAPPDAQDPHGGRIGLRPAGQRPVRPARVATGRSSPPGRSGRTCRLTAYRLINEN